MSPDPLRYPRRRLLQRFMQFSGLALASGGSVAAAGLIGTPAQTAGPFYPLEVPTDADNNLVQVRGRERSARGQVLNLSGRVLTGSGRPVAGARVEIWQCDANGRYHHPLDSRAVQADPDFQGYGADHSGPDGRYRFVTIRPVAYPGRTPHIHFAISVDRVGTLITQMYVAGEPRNERDGVLNRIHNPQAKASVIVALTPDPDAPANLVATFDIILAADGRVTRADTAVMQRLGALRAAMMAV